MAPLETLKELVGKKIELQKENKDCTEIEKEIETFVGSIPKENIKGLSGTLVSEYNNQFNAYKSGMIVLSGYIENKLDVIKGCSNALNGKTKAEEQDQGQVM